MSVRIHLLVALLCCCCTSCRAFLSPSRLESDKLLSSFVSIAAAGSDLRVDADASNKRRIKRSRWLSHQRPASSSLRMADGYTASMLDTAVTSWMHLSTSILATTTTTVVSPEPIHTAFSIATFLPQPFWLLLILFPNAPITKQIMGGMEVILLCSLVHLLIVVASIVTGGADATAPIGIFTDVFDISGDPQAAFMRFRDYPNFIAEEWSHVLTWDLLVGRYIWLDGLKRQIPTQLSVLFCNLIGPPGLLIHFATCLFQGKPLCEKPNDE